MIRNRSRELKRRGAGVIEITIVNGFLIECMTFPRQTSSGPRALGERQLWVHLIAVFLLSG